MRSVAGHSVRRTREGSLWSPLAAISARLLLAAATACLTATTALAQDRADPAIGKSYNTKTWYPEQLSTATHQQGLTFNGVDQRATITMDASTLVAGRSRAGAGIDGDDRFRVRLLLNVFDPTPGHAQVILMIGGETHGWGVGYSATGNLFLALRNGNAGYHSIGCPFPADGQMRDVVFDLNSEAPSITVDGVAKSIEYAYQGGPPTLDKDVCGGAALGNRADGAENLFHHILEGASFFENAASDTDSFVGVMGPIGDYLGGTGDLWFHGAVSYLALTRGNGSEPSHVWEMNEGQGAPTGTPSMIENNASWGGAPADSFLFHWPLATLDYNLASTGSLGPADAPIVGAGPLGMASWSDSEEYGLPTMAEGPLGVAARTQVLGAPRHSELYMATPLYNVPEYYVAWTGYIDTSALEVPGEFSGSVRLNRFSDGDSPAGTPGVIIIAPNSVGKLRLYWVGDFIGPGTIFNIIPLDSHYRGVVRYVPRDEAAGVSGVIEFSIDGGATWPLTASYDRVDNRHFRIGWRTVSEAGGRQWIRDLAYGSSLQEVWNAVTPNGADLNADTRVDGFDLAAMLSMWGSGGGAADLDGDGEVGGSDLAMLLAQWTG
jgi:hypothetical protein